jgi:predicted transcriptional regulator
VVSNVGAKELAWTVDDFERVAEQLRVMAHPVRLCIIRGLIDQPNCNVSEMQDCLQIPQSSLSTHLQKLRSAGILRGKRKGHEVVYDVVLPMAIEMMRALEQTNPTGEFK